MLLQPCGTHLTRQSRQRHPTRKKPFQICHNCCFCHFARRPNSSSYTAAVHAPLLCCQSRFGIHIRRAAVTTAALMEELHNSSLPGLCATCALMFAAAYGSGMLPSWLSISEQRLASVNALGAGLLLGSALGIILPEGFEAAMEAHHDSQLAEWSMPFALLAGFWCMLLLDSLSHLLPASDSSSSSSNAPLRQPHSGCGTGHVDLVPDELYCGAEEHVVLLTDTQAGCTTTAARQYGSQPGTPKSTQRINSAVAESSNTGSARIPASKGVARSGGSFKQIAAAAAAAKAEAESSAAATAAAASWSAGSSGSQQHRAGSSIGVVTSAAVEQQCVPAGLGFTAGTGRAWTSWAREPAQQALIGLVVHAASDGLAVGAASLAAEPAVSLSVALAMVVHKGPVAVGLSTYLKSGGWKSDRIQKGILLFSAASPVAALLTYLVLSSLPFLSSGGHIPLAVLFSGGTVLYAATVHIVPSALGRNTQQHNHHSSQSYSTGGAAAGPLMKGVHSSGSRAATSQSAPSRLLLMLVSVGMLLPLVLSAVFHHEHGR